MGAALASPMLIAAPPALVGGTRLSLTQGQLSPGFQCDAANSPPGVLGSGSGEVAVRSGFPIRSQLSNVLRGPCADAERCGCGEYVVVDERSRTTRPHRRRRNHGKSCGGIHCSPPLPVGGLPVVDHDGRFVGVVPPLALMHILRHKHVEDLHKPAGITKETRRTREAMPLWAERFRLHWHFKNEQTGEADHDPTRNGRSAVQ